MNTYRLDVTLRTGVSIPVQVEAADRVQARSIALRMPNAVSVSYGRDVAADWLIERRVNSSPLNGGAR